MSETSRVDMHVHSSASEISKLGVQRSLRLPECATAPEEVYELAKRRGMDFVTITDHDTIAGALAIEDHPDVFISEELTASFKDEPRAAVHVLCYGITPDDHDWLQARRDDVEECAAYLHEREITAALAHPFYAVAAPLSATHRRRLAELFPIWETRNGSRAKELNLPAFVYIETHGGTAIGGSDDHAGIDIGRTFTETPRASTPEEFLGSIRAGRATTRGAQGSAAKWTHAAIALAIRSLKGVWSAPPPDPVAVLKIVQRVMSEGDARTGTAKRDLGPEDATALLRSWLAAMDLGSAEDELIGLLQEEKFSHGDLYRRGCRIHERSLDGAVSRFLTSTARAELSPQQTALDLFNACIPAIPYAAAAAFLGREKLRLSRSDGDAPRVALIAEGLGAMHGVTHTVQQIRERGVPGFELDVIGTDPHVDRRLTAVAEIEIPFYSGLKIGVPSLLAVVDALGEGRYDLIHLATPGPTGVAAWLLGRVLNVPLVGSYHTELAAYAGLRTRHPQLGALVKMLLGVFYGACDKVFSPSPASDASLKELGIREQRIGRWARGVDMQRFDPGLRTPGLLPGELNVFYAGRLSKEKGIDLLADAFLAAHRRDPRLHLVLAGGGPEQEHLRERLGEHATFLGWLGGEELARAYASADMFLFASQTDTYGQAVVEAQASGLPVVAVAEGGPLSLISDGVTGLLAPADPGALADRLLALAHQQLLRDRLGCAGHAAVANKSWHSSLQQLASGYRAALSRAGQHPRRKAA